MKVSVLIPSLDEDFLQAVLPQVRQTGTGVPLEIVVCSPYKPKDEGVVWVEDQIPTGNQHAVRAAFARSSGDVVAIFPDDITLAPGWLASGLPLLQDNCIVSLTPAQTNSCFGYLYANNPLVHRTLIETHGKYFYPYQAHWGDVAFSLAVWRAGGKVVEVPYRLIYYLGRDKHPESPVKLSAFDADCMAFLADFQDMANDWLLRHWRLFNYPELNN